MFDNRLECLSMLEGSYRKLKSYYYYNKNYIVMREKIAMFESNQNGMTAAFERLCNLLAQPNNKESIDYFQSLLHDVNFCVLPKKFESEQEEVLKQFRMQKKVKEKPRKKPDIKKLPARFDNSRAKRKIKEL